MTNKAALDYTTIFESLPIVCALLEVPDFRIVAVTDEYLRVSQRTRDDIIGKKITEAFPDNPYDEDVTGATSLRGSLETVLRTKLQHKMGVLRYDIKLPDEAGGGFIEKWWRSTNTPVLGKDGSVKHIIHIVEDVSYMLGVLEDAEDTLKKKAAQRMAHSEG